MTQVDPMVAASEPRRADSPLIETRFALVLNGGVSLAVWMGGVTHEVNRLRLASFGDDGAPSDPAELRVHRAWQEILKEVSRRATVDVVAGTSAGGLNGTVLATAVARGCDLPPMRKRWLDVASLTTETLLREDQPDRESLLSGDFFQEQIDDLLRKLRQSRPVVEPAESTLLVTATAIDGRPDDVRLEGDARATLSDSRRVFRFRHLRDASRETVQNHFDTDLDALALAARASASFPLAFEPVLESEQLRGLRHPATPGTHREQLIDGGVLDNAPFGPLLEELAERPISAPFERVILYVTPSPGQAISSSLAAPPPVTDVVKRVVGAARCDDQARWSRTCDDTV